jgi:5-methylcytosine-specific restriction endonuclease McrBC regulatory subunit McrC
MFKQQKEDEQISRNSRKLFPDFYKKNFILDAKYKHLGNGIGREDLYQVVTYMYCKQAEHGGYIYPDEGMNQYCKFQLTGYEGFIHLLPVAVPPKQFNQKTFIEAMRLSEKELREYIQKVNN